MRACGRTTKRRWARLLAAALVIGLAGCTSTVDGVARKDPHAASSDDANLALLDTGAYPVTAGHPFGTAGAGGGYFEGQRMAEYVMGPWRADSMLRQLEPLPTLALFGSDFGNEILPDPLPHVAIAHGFIAGFSSTRKSLTLNPLRALQNMVMRFPDPQSAAAAAQEMTAVNTGEAKRPVTILNHPEASAWAYDRGDGGVAVRNFTAHGPYMLVQLAIANHDYNNDQSAGLLVSGTLTQQGQMIDRFAPTDPARLAELPKDPSGWLLARVLWAPDEKAPRTEGVWTPRAALHFETDPVESDALFDATGVEWMGQRLTRVYQTKSPDGAARVVAKFAEQTRALPGVSPVGVGVPGLPSAKCFVRSSGFASPLDAPTIQQAQWHYKCIAQADRFAFVAFSQQQADAMQQTSAQWRILAGK